MPQYSEILRGIELFYQTDFPNVQFGVRPTWPCICGEFGRIAPSHDNGRETVKCPKHNWLAGRNYWQDRMQEIGASMGIDNRDITKEAQFTARFPQSYHKYMWQNPYTGKKYFAELLKGQPSTPNSAIFVADWLREMGHVVCLVTVTHMIDAILSRNEWIKEFVTRVPVLVYFDGRDQRKLSVGSDMEIIIRGRKGLTFYLEQ